MHGGNRAVPGNDEISPGISWRLTRAARYPLDPPAIVQVLGLGNGLISKIRVSSLDRARDAIDLVAATVDAPGLVEHAIFGEDLVDCRAPMRGVVFTEDVVKIAGQQGRYAVGHGLVSSRHRVRVAISRSEFDKRVHVHRQCGPCTPYTNRRRSGISCISLSCSRMTYWMGVLRERGGTRRMSFDAKLGSHALLLVRNRCPAGSYCLERPALALPPTAPSNTRQ